MMRWLANQKGIANHLYWTAFFIGVAWILWDLASTGQWAAIIACFLFGVGFQLFVRYKHGEPE